MNTRKPPVKRAFHGLSGSSFSVTTGAAPQAKPKDPRKELVLVHFCFDQERGDSKPDRCTCSLRIDKTVYELVDAKQADFLLVANPKTNKPTKFHRAIVVRRMVVAGETIFALTAPMKLDRRDKKHDEIKYAIREKARAQLQVLFAAGSISSLESEMSETELDAVLQYPDGFIAKFLDGQRKRWVKISLAWWANILGYHRLDENHGQYGEGADRGAGLAINVRLKRGEGLSGKLEQVSAAHENDTGRVRVANHKAHFWNGGWSYGAGADPSVDYDETDHVSYAQSSHERAGDDDHE